MGPLIMTGLIAWNGAWRMGYLGVATLLLVLALLFGWTRRAWDDPTQSAAAQEKMAGAIGMRDALGHSLVWLQIVLFFVYTGLEITVGQWSFTILTESRGLSKEMAGLLVTVYWGSILTGRVLFGMVADRFGLDRLVRLSTIAALAGTAMFALNRSVALDVIALALSGLGLAAIYPCLMSRTPQRLGKALAAHAIGFQVSAAMLGAAALPSLSGFLSQGFGLEAIGVAAMLMAIVLMALHESVLAVSKNRKEH